MRLIRKIESPIESGSGSDIDDSMSSSVRSLQSSTGAETTLVVSPNLSMSWRANMVLAGAIAIICLGTGLLWAWLGFWVVLPFAGAEVIFVTLCLYLTVRKLTVKEVITISSDEIRVEWGRTGPVQSIKLPRHWTKLIYRCSDSPMEVGELTVRAYGKSYALGSALGRQEKHQLYTELNKLI